MHLKCTTVLAGLFTLSQTIWTTQAIPVTSLQAVDDKSVLVRDNWISQVDNLQVVHAKRAPADPDWPTILHMNEDSLLKTWSGWIVGPDNSGWDPDTIVHWAILAHKHIRDQITEPWILAALWIIGEGVAFGSQAHGKDFEDRRADQKLEDLLRAHARVPLETR